MKHFWKNNTNIWNFKIRQKVWMFCLKFPEIQNLSKKTFFWKQNKKKFIIFFFEEQTYRIVKNKQEKHRPKCVFFWASFGSKKKFWKFECFSKIFKFVKFLIFGLWSQFFTDRKKFFWFFNFSKVKKIEPKWGIFRFLKKIFLQSF